MLDKSEEITEFFSDEDSEQQGIAAELRLLLLIENTSCDEEIIPEHGLSIYIEFNGIKGLYDTGQSSQFLENAEAMYTDLADLDWISLSHGHYDHTGGLKDVLDITSKKIPVYIGKDAFQKKYARRDNDRIEEIGIPFAREEIAPITSEIIEVESGVTEIAENVYLVGPAPLKESYEGPSTLYANKEFCW